MIFRVAPTRASWDAIIVALWIGLIDTLLYRWVMDRPNDWLRVLLMITIISSALGAAVLLYRTWGLVTLTYRLQNDVLFIEWSGGSHEILLAQLRRVSPRAVVQRPLTRDWWRWPCTFMRVERGATGALLTMLATRPLSLCVLLDTGQQLVALSPETPELFLQALQEKRRSLLQAPAEARATQAIQPVRSHPQSFDLRYLWSHDPAMRITMLAGLLMSLLLFALLSLRYPFLPDSMAIRFGGDGAPELVRNKSGLFLLPMIGLAAWFVNSIWGLLMASRQQITGAYLLWGGAIIVNLYLFFALLSLVR